MSPPVRPRRDPLLDAADALESGRLTHEQIRAQFTPEANAAAARQDIDLGPMAAAGLGAARGASFGLSDFAQRLLLNPTEKESVQTTAEEHPTATTAGTVAGGSLPFLLTAGGATLPGLGLRGTQAAIGAGEGFGLTPGDPSTRAVGAALGAGTSLAAPFLARVAGSVAGRIPLIGPALRAAGNVAERVTGPVSRAIGRLTGVAAPAAESAVSSTQADLAEQLGTKEPMRAPHPDAAKAIQDFEAGRLDEQGLRDALDQAAGRPFEARPQVAPTVPSDAAPPPPVVPATAQAGSGGAKVLPFVRPTIKELATLPGGTPPPAPGLRAGEAAAPIAGTEGRGIEVTGPRATPAPPTTPTILEMQEGNTPRPQHPVFSGEQSFTRSPEVRQGEPLTPSTAGMPRTTESPPGAGLPPATQEGFAKLFGQPESFEGGGFGKVRQIMQSPMYQRAGSLAKQFLRTPNLTAKFPEFAEMDEPTLTRALQRLILEQGRTSGGVPALTSLSSFLEKLTSQPAGIR